MSASSSGDPRQSNLQPRRDQSSPIRTHSPLSLYTRLFGPGFQDPTKGDWKPDPRTMIQKSVVSAVAEDRHRIMQKLGASDRARMDQYFTSVRQTELQMEAELQRPNIEAKVSIPDAPSADIVANNASPNLRVVTPLMARLGAIALATDQTRVFNLSVSSRRTRCSFRAIRSAFTSPPTKSRSIPNWATSLGFTSTTSRPWSFSPRF